MPKSDVKLLKVDASANNNKFYNFHDNGDNTFTVTYGRVGTDGVNKTYEMWYWDELYKKKTDKGYKDVTGNTREVVGYIPVSDAEINKLLNAFLENSRQFVSNFTETNMLTQAAQDEVQDYINRLAKNMDVKNPDNLTLNAFNKDLLKIFEYIPRKMSSVQSGLAQHLDDRQRIIKREQDLLDNIVALSKSAPKQGATQTIEDAFGFTLTNCSSAEIDFIKDRLQKDGFYRYKFNRAWKINTPAREDGFKEYLENNKLKDNDKNVKLYWHGTGTENILSIMSTGLKIRPSNVSTTGSMYGNGIYSAPNADKASGYTSIAGSYWKGGDKNVAYMFLNAVITGKQYDVKDNYETYGGITIRNLDGDKFSSADLGYHSVYAHAGGYLKRDEVIVYNENQVACRYLIEFKTN